MKIRAFLILTSFAGAAVAASAAPSVVLPRPVEVTSPQRLPAALEGETVYVEMTIDAQGQPSRVRVVRPVDDGAAAKIAAAVERWKFTAPQRDGRATRMRVILPVKLTMG